MELAAKKLDDDEIKKIASDPFVSWAPLSIVRLLCHIEWQNEEMERIAEERDSLRDAESPRNRGPVATPPVDGCPSLPGTCNSFRILGEVCKELDIHPHVGEAVLAVRRLKEQLRSASSRPMPHLTLTQIHKFMDFLKNAAHVYYSSNGGQIGG